MNNFEFDENKSKSNQQKHGINFKEAIELWKDDNRLEIPSKFVDEERFVLIAKFENRIWSAIFTIRNRKIRIISVRRARKNEEKLYISK